MKALGVVVIAAVVGSALYLFVAQLSPSAAEQLEKAMKLASVILGFAMTVFGAVKSVLGLTKAIGATTDEVVPAGVTAGIGVFLLIASRFS